MDRRETLLCVAVTAMLGVFLAVAPARIIAAREPLTLIYSGESAEGYRGIIDVWHIAGFRPYQGSLGGWLSKRAEKLEKQHDGVYFEVLSMSVEESEMRIARGERPDVFSFPSGWAYAEQLEELQGFSEPLRGGLAESGVSEGRCFSRPYAVSGYLLLTNDRRLQERGMQSSGALEALRRGELTLAGNAAQALHAGATGEAAPEEAFKEGDADAGYFDARFAGDAKRRLNDGRGFVFGAVAATANTDLVQYLGVARGISAEARPYAEEFIALALESEPQEALYELGLVPARADAGEYGGDEAHIKLLCEELKAPVVPNAFLYKAYRDALQKSAAAALAGEESAKKDFRLRWIELVDGGGIK